MREGGEAGLVLRRRCFKGPEKSNLDVFGQGSLLDSALLQIGNNDSGGGLRHLVVLGFPVVFWHFVLHPTRSRNLIG